MGQTNSSLSLGVKASSGRTAATNNVPPLLFHPVHGDNIQLTEGGQCARRVHSYCNGIVFSNRPVAVNERVVLKLAQVSDEWSGVMRLGFTTVDPRTHTAGLPKYSCPDLTSKPGFWARALSERFAEPGRLLFFSLTSSGDVHLGLDGAERGVFLSGVDTSRPCWALVDVYGNVTAVEIVHSPRPVSSLEERLSEESGTRSGVGRVPGGRLEPGRPPAGQRGPRSSGEPPPATAETPESPSPRSDEDAAAMARLAPCPLNPSVLGGSVSVHADDSEAVRGAGDTAGYVFCCSPLPVGGRLSVRLLSTTAPRSAGLTFGLTSCDPGSLAVPELPADPALLVDRPEYWPIVSEAVAWPMVGERLDFLLAADGAVTLARGGGRPRALMHVDASLPLWPLLALTGAVRALKVLGVDTPGEARPVDDSGSGGERVSPSHVPHTERDTAQDLSSHRPPCLPHTVDTSCAETAVSRSVAASPGVSSPSSAAAATASDCSICLDRACDAALYACGHVCLCYTCAVQWRARGSGRCPLCCAPIRDVIRLYHS